MKSLVQQTLERLKSVQELILSIEQYDFPFDDSKDALDAIEELIDGQIEQLQDQITEASNPAAARTYCERAGDDISNCLPVLGLIVRSAEPIGALELQWPLKQLTKRALKDPKAKLVISSDWNYSPFTLTPLQIDKHIVLVGMPMSEANNALVAPLAGHELGHNIWRSHSLGPQVETWVTKGIDGKVAWTNKQKREGRRAMAFEWAFYQSEEIFCDIIGLLMFRESYLHSFHYLLAIDREQHRSGYYPSIQNRTAILCKFAKKAAIKIPRDFQKGFTSNSTTQTFIPLEEVLRVADQVAHDCADNIFKLAKAIVDELKLCETTPNGVAHVLSYFNRLVPARGAKCFQDIINAAWEFELNRGSEKLADHKTREVSLVSELAFKTCEVFQIESILNAS